jgi:hypothetical protein
VIFAQVIDVRRALARSGVYRKAEVSRHRSEICRCQATNESLSTGEPWRWHSVKVGKIPALRFSNAKIAIIISQS